MQDLTTYFFFFFFFKKQDRTHRKLITYSTKTIMIIIYIEKLNWLLDD